MSLYTKQARQGDLKNLHKVNELICRKIKSKAYKKKNLKLPWHSYFQFVLKQNIRSSKLVFGQIFEMSDVKKAYKQFSPEQKTSKENVSKA